MHKYFLYFFLLALTPQLVSTTTPEPAQFTQAELKEHITSEKIIRNLIGLKDVLESNLLESEDGVWPCSDELFRKTAQLIISCYKLKQKLHSLQARIYIATLEDYVASLVQQPTQLLARSTVIVKKLTDKALGEISVATKAPLLHTDDQTIVATLAFEKNIRATILFIKNQFLPIKPIEVKHNTMLKKAQRKGRRAYNYVAETVKEHPFASGVVAAAAIIATAYWIKHKYSKKPANPGDKKPSEPGAPVLRPASSTSNVTTKPIAAAPQSSKEKPDGISCGYHSAVNADFLTKELIKKEAKLGRALTLQEFDDFISKELKWPTRDHIQDTLKAAFLAIKADKITTLEAEVAAQIITSALQQSGDLNTKRLEYQLSVLQNLINGGKTIDGQTVKEFIQFFKEHGNVDEEAALFDDPDDKHHVYWKVLDKGSTHMPGIGSVDGEYEKCMFTLQSLRKVRKLLKDNPAASTMLKEIIYEYRRNGYPDTPSKEFIAKTEEGTISVAELTETRDFKNPVELPTAIKLLNQFHTGKRLVFNWREGYHWTCCVGVPELDSTTTPPKIKAAKGFAVDSMGPSVPAGFASLLTLLATEKPLDDTEIQTFKEIWE